MSTPIHARARAAGFTLIEVMIVVAIIAILASVAMPAYTEYVRRGQIQEAFSNLSSYRNRLEQYYQDNRRYAATAAGTTCAGAANATLTEAELGSEAEFFTYSCTPSDNAQGYTVTAAGASGAATGNTYTLNHNGERRTTKFKGTDLNPAATCWRVKDAC